VAFTRIYSKGLPGLNKRFTISLPEQNQKVYQGIKDEKIVAEPAEWLQGQGVVGGALADGDEKADLEIENSKLFFVRLNIMTLT